MKIKIGYYPMLDMALAIRQIYSVERFKPFCISLEWLDSRLSKEEKDKINTIAASTHDWLDVIKKMIDMTMEGITSPEEMFIKVSKNPEYIFGLNAKNYMSEMLSDIWYNHCFVEMSKYSKQISSKAMEISKRETKEELLDYILGLSDRIEREENNIIKFNIKPEFKVHVDDIENIIVMPSIFSSRNVAFWYSEKTFLFFVALDSKPMTLQEPSDMLLLRTLAFNDKTRLKMLRTLTQSALSVNDMADKMKINASTVSRHFKVFKDVGFVDIQRQEGNSIYYGINENEIKKSMESIYNYIFKEDKS
ncbi:ArsR/SmtB family transcription factor [Oceanirhabdus seepicola]|uniref:Winged helix-turn-helix transcriptional regulator n=1 Tax=Oceanirhabdus seepicola TaxID=2828781 RepID=A0A9J6P8U6_9CLOT|nr:metalloregulator ArsR/SmtB family transcription factor [Oceanirhabdus seepicola]MCM1991848.1 winged helix-turn-helix transcriptional regulator [Oceanirhabdus seepicola]